MTRKTPLDLGEDQVLWFRARRGCLAGPGAPDAVTAARAVVGLQAQKAAPALLGLSQRMAARPTAAELSLLLSEPPRALVRTWGQRETLHLFDAAEDWAEVAAARGQWAPGGRRGPMPDGRTLEAGLRAMRQADGPVDRDALFDVVPPAYLKKIAELAEGTGLSAERLAAARVLWCLALRGDLCLAGKSGARRLHALREDWYPDLAWPAALDPPAAAARLARRYLAAYGPATPADVAHFFGARVREADGWLAALAPELIRVSCGGRKDLVALAADAADLRADPPSGRGWPLRLLPLWDNLLMGHRDKTWTAPAAAERPAIWRRGAHVSATALHRGRIVAVWTHAKRRGGLRVEVTPLGGWRKAMLPGLRREARAVSAHMELTDVEVLVVD